jgi:hypothetical protein
LTTFHDLPPSDDAKILRAFVGENIDMAKRNPAPASPPATVPLSLVDNPHAPDVYADEVVGFFINNGVVKITLSSARVNHGVNPGPVNRVVIGRLVMPIQAAQALAAGLFDFLKSRGADPSGGRMPN